MRARDRRSSRARTAAVRRAWVVVPLALVVGVAFGGSAAGAKPGVDTIIDSGPAAFVSSTSATLTFHSTGTGATFACSLDGAPASACTSPKSYSGLSVGKHTFSVASTAGGITDTSPATTSWTVDTTPPSAPTGLTATAQSATSVALTWKPGTDANGVTGEKVLRNGTVIATLGAVSNYTDSTAAAATTYSYTVISVDAAGNESSQSSPATATTPAAPSAPDTVIDSGPAALVNTTSATFTFHATVSGATFTCALDAAKAAACTSPRSLTGLANGPHTFKVVATANGLTDATPATATWTVDTVAPTVPSGLSAKADTGTVTLSWTASTDASGVVGYDVYRGGTLLATTAATTYTDSAVSTGQGYTYAVRARDGAGNVSALSPSVTVIPTTSYDAHLTRAPYLTDLVGLHVNVNFATDQTGTTGSVQYGAVGTGGSCSPTSTVAASRTTILVGTIYEYQWKASLTLPATGSYCYRVYLGSDDLLAGNTSPQFTTQVQPGATDSFSFDVLGDWGQVDTTGQNPDQSALMSQIALSGARFAVTVGDNGYTNGSQINYGDLQQTGSGTSAIFGPSFWTVPGQRIPLFTAVGNHGVSGTAHTDITTWTQDQTVSQSGGRYQNDVYCCVNGSNPSNYGSEWYAFTAGNVRFYVLDSAWGDTNPGTATPYANDALAHFAPGTPEYTWLLNDLTTHPTQLKFAFSHFPFYSDNNTQTSDTYLQGANNLEGLLGQHGVQLVFNGHAHIYQRNAASAAGMPITYVTGGGGSTLEPIGPCTSADLYGIGWSPSSSSGSACGAARAPSAAANVFHFLKVTVSGTTVTVSPTDSTGAVFDQKSYTFKVPTDTYIDSAPPAGTTSNSATFTFHGSATGATYTCQLDAGTASSCTSPKTYTGLAAGKHTFSVAATVNKSKDPTPATATWTIDSTPPTAPTSVTATATSPFSVDVAWSGATDNTGVTAYRVYRDSALLSTVTGATTFTDDTAHASSTYVYSVVALDIANNASAAKAAAAITTGAPPVPIFSDGFESGGLTAWTTSHGLTVGTTTTNSGTYAVEGNTTTGAVYAKKTLPATYPDAWARVAFNVIAQPSQVNLLRLRDSAGNSLGYAYIETTGQLGWHNDALGTNTLSDVSPSTGWHTLEVHRLADASGTTTGAVGLWLDGVPVTDLSNSSLDVGAAPVGAIQIGETQTNQTYDVAFDDVAFATARLGPSADTTPPSVPAGLAGNAGDAFSATLTWNAATDDVGVVGYDIARDGVLIDSVGSTLTYTDTSLAANSTHQFAVRARDGSGNASAWSSPVSITQPSAAPPLFVDGFESGDVSAWTTTTGLSVESADVRTGTYSAEGNTATTAGPQFAKKTLATTYPDAYARVAFEANALGTSQVALLRLRDTPTGTGGYVFLTPTGHLAFRSDALAAASVSATVPGPGWHTLELHLGVAGANSSVGVWLDGAAVPDLTFATTDLGAVAGIGVLQIGDTGTVDADVLYDDAAFSTSRIGVAVDSTPPTAPATVTAAANDPFTVAVNWTPSTDDVGVTGYDILRGGTLLASVPATATSFVDSTALASSSYLYGVRARDGSGNVSTATSTMVSTPAAATPLFSDGFETGDLSAWTSSAGMTVEGTDVRSGSSAAEAATTTSVANAKRTLAASYTDAYARVAFNVVSQSTQLTLLRLRDTSAGNGGYVYLSSSGALAFRSDALLSGVVSTVRPATGWHVLELHLAVAGAGSQVQVWLDGTAVSALSTTTDLGTVAGIGVLQIGDTASTTADIRYDDAAFSTSRIGLGGDTTPPTAPGAFAASATDAFTVGLSWTASTDDTGVVGYDILRGGTLLTTVAGTATSFVDATASPLTAYCYAIRARDAAGNASPLATASATTPAAAAPLFSDGFETGDLSAWTSSAGMTVEGTDVRSGSSAAEAATTTSVANAKRTLAASYTDAYARVAFNVVSQGSQVTLLRLRDTSAGKGGYVYLSSSGALAFRSDALLSGVVSTVRPAAGWHVLELHLAVAGAGSQVQVWLDGTAVSALSATTDLGTVAGIGVLQIGDTASTTADIRYDDAAFSTSRIGLGGDVSAPTAPGAFTATANGPFSVGLTWTASTDDTGVVGYDLLRDNTMLVAALTPDTVSWTDSTALASTSYTYTIRARDAAGNVSPLVTAAVSTPAAAPPSFADGFESGTLSAWTTTNGLSVESTDVHTGGFAAHTTTPGTASAMFAKKAVTAASDAYARVAFKVNSQTSSRVTLLRLRDTATGTANGGYVYISSSGALGFHADSANTFTGSSVMAGPGWHVVELHLTMGTSGSVQVWLDGNPVTDLAGSAVNLGANPVANFQIGETATNVTADIELDDAAFSTSRIGVS